MALRLIVGPPNSGRTGAVLDELERRLERRPVLVVPTSDDVERLEHELTQRELGLGVTIVSFGGLQAEVTRASGIDSPPVATLVQRRELARRALSATRLRLLAGSAARRGFVPALERLFAELASAGVSPAIASSRGQGSNTTPVLLEIGAAYGAYERGLAEAGLAGEHEPAARANAALAANPALWGARDVFLLGFDDLAPLQLELLSVLAEAASVTTSVTYEDRDAGSARARLLEDLLDRGAEVVVSLDPNPAHTSSPALHRLERGFLRPGAEPGPPDEGIGLMVAAGERGAAEQVAAEVAHLISRGEDPREIAIVLREPSRQALLWESVLAAYGVPAAIDASIDLTATATGRGLTNLLRAWLPGGNAADLLAFLRSPGCASPGEVDWLERRIRRDGIETAAGALEAWSGRSLFELEDLDRASGGRELLIALARSARNLAERPYRRGAPTTGRHLELELRAAEVAARTLEELAVLMGGVSAHDAALTASLELATAEVSLRSGSGGDRVRVTSPYRVRARRVRILFVCSLQDGEFPRPDGGEAFLTPEDRQALGIPPRSEALAEERYLFWTCLSRPTERLRLCWRSCDDEGAEERPSPFIADALALIDDPGGSLSVAHRHLADVVLEPEQAPVDTELARALAASAGELPADKPAVAARLSQARAILAQGDPKGADDPAVLAELSRREVFGASTLEEYATCSFRWFVSHELSPRDLEPEPDARAQGSIVHGVLERLYREPPGQESVPRPETLDAWLERALKLSAELAAEAGLGGHEPRGRLARTRIDALIRGFLEREAASGSRLRPDPGLLEASFGETEGDQRPPLELEGLRLHGKIDRVDLTPDGEAGLVRDYKVSVKVASRKQLTEQGKLQIQLYALALDRLWDRRPLGGLYEPLASNGDRRGRGLLLADETDGALAGLDSLRGDRASREDFERALVDAEQEAGRLAGSMRKGRVTRDPRDDECPPWCTFAGICRRQRAARTDIEDRDEEREAE